MAKTLGVIAEDQSDVDVVKELAKKIARAPFTVRHFVGRGCGKIKTKGRLWAKNLRDQGCGLLIVVHDLDTNDEEGLRCELASSFAPCPVAKHVIVIPVREIEAWLLSDSSAIKNALKLKKNVKATPNPEAVHNPKERLKQLVAKASENKVTYLNTVHNVKIATQTSLSNVKRCRSFLPLHGFLNSHLR